MIKTRKNIWNDKNGVTSVIETIISTAVVFIILLLFFASVNNLYRTHNRPELDLEVKAQDICEMLISSPGRNDTFNSEWEKNVGAIDFGSIGLAAAPTLSYGTFSGTSFNDPIYDFFQQSNIGTVTLSCFLAETQIILADGSTKNIEDVQVDDLVKSYDIETGNIVNSPVINVFHHSPGEMTDYYLVVNNFLKVTPNHLFCKDDRWISFDKIKIGDIINHVSIYSIEKVFEKVTTFDLEIETNHNYFIYFPDTSLLVHNEPIIKWDPWLATSKNADLQDPFAYYGDNYYVEYTDIGGGNGLYEVKGENHYPYPVIDSQKIDNLSQLNYADVKSIFGLVDDYKYYNFNISINSASYSLRYGPSYDSSDVIVSITRSVLIYYPPFIYDLSNIDPPYYEPGQITIYMFIGGFLF